MAVSINWSSPAGVPALGPLDYGKLPYSKLLHSEDAAIFNLWRMWKMVATVASCGR